MHALAFYERMRDEENLERVVRDLCSFYGSRMESWQRRGMERSGFSSSMRKQSRAP